MSAAANAAGYLYAHGQLPVSEFNGKVEAARAVKPQSELVKQTRAPKIEYRKRRSYAVPSDGTRTATPGVTG